MLTLASLFGTLIAIGVLLAAISDALETHLPRLIAAIRFRIRAWIGAQA